MILVTGEAKLNEQQRTKLQFEPTPYVNVPSWSFRFGASLFVADVGITQKKGRRFPYTWI